MIMVARKNPVALSASPELLEPFAKDIKVYINLKNSAYAQETKEGRGE